MEIIYCTGRRGFIGQNLLPSVKPNVLADCNDDSKAFEFTKPTPTAHGRALGCPFIEGMWKTISSQIFEPRFIFMGGDSSQTPLFQLPKFLKNAFIF